MFIDTQNQLLLGIVGSDWNHILLQETVIQLQGSSLGNVTIRWKILKWVHYTSKNQKGCEKSFLNVIMQM